MSCVSGVSLGSPFKMSFTPRFILIHISFSRDGCAQTCLDRPVDTVALPCGHRFACGRSPLDSQLFSSLTAGMTNVPLAAYCHLCFVFRLREPRDDLADVRLLVVFWCVCVGLSRPITDGHSALCKGIEAVFRSATHSNCFAPRCPQLFFP